MSEKHISLLYADTGGGHRASAQAVERAIVHLHGDTYTTELLNAINALPYPFDQAEKAYPLAISQSRLGYELLWNASNNRTSTAAARILFETAGARARAFLNKHPADIYVSCHSLINQAIPQALRGLGRDVPVVGVVSDLSTVHALFWSPKIAHYTVPSQAARNRAVKNGVSPARITVAGQPVLPDFAARVRASRAGVAPGAPVVLVMGGGDGMGRMLETVQALAQSDLPIRIVAVCGRNTQARAAIDAMPKRAPTQTLGFSDAIPELMGEADILVTKAGPGAICEGFVAGLPIILYDAVPGQESGNVAWVTQSGAGHWRPSPNEVLAQIRAWLAQPGDLERARARSLAQAQPDAALTIARVIVDTMLTRPVAGPRPAIFARAARPARDR